MKITLTDMTALDFPEALRPFVTDKIYDSSSSPEARVYRIGSDSYLKRGKRGSLRREAVMTEYFHKKSLAPPVISYISEGEDWLLTEAARGDDATHGVYQKEPKRLAALLGESLRSLHETDFSDCPIPDRMESYFKTAEENYGRGICDLSFSGLPSPAAAWDRLTEGRDILTSRVLLHGDFCLPNIILDNWKLSAYIDLGGGGVGDRHIDLFWGAWTLNFNLGTDAYRNIFFDAYGRDLINEEALRVIAAAECFG